MPVDSQVVNGRFIGVGHDEPASLEIDQGRVVSINGDPEVWRTVDASGYYVLPGAVQPGDPAPENALDLVLQGITSLIAQVHCDPSQLSGEIDRIDSTLILDAAISWFLPQDATASDVYAARQLGVRIFDLSDHRLDHEALGELAGTTIRCPAKSQSLEDVLSLASGSTIVLTGVSADELAIGTSLKSAGTANTFLEVELKDLLDDDDALWSAIAGGQVDIISGAGSNEAMLQSLYGEWLIRRGLEMPGLVELLASTPALVHGLTPGKGTLGIGSDADFLVFDPNQVSDIAGKAVPGRVIYGQLRGEILLFDNELHLPPGSGRML